MQRSQISIYIRLYKQDAGTVTHVSYGPIDKLYDHSDSPTIAIDTTDNALACNGVIPSNYS